MKDLYTKIDKLKSEIDEIKDEKYLKIFNSLSEILIDLSSKVEDLNLRQEYLEENIEYIDYDLTDIQDELFEEVTFDDLNGFEDEYVEINCEKCNKPLFVEQQTLNNNNPIPCPFCGGMARE